MATEARSNDLLFSDFSSVDKSRWLEQLTADLKGADPKKLTWKTGEGFDVEPMYFEEDIDGIEHMDFLPGEAPFVRGGQSLGHRLQPWCIAQRITSRDACGAGEELRTSFAAGQTGAEIPVASGYTDESSGLELRTVDDMNTLLAAADPAVHALTFRAGCTPAVLTGLFHAWTSAKNIDWTAPLRITADPLSVLAERAALPRPLDTCMASIADTLRSSSDVSPQLKSIEVRADVFHNAGATTVQETALTLAAGVEYLHRLTDIGCDAKRVAEVMSFTFPVGTNHFMEVAKLRAARMLWSMILREYGIDGEGAPAMDMHTVTSKWYHTAFDPWVNMLRGTVEAMSGALGGTQSMHTEPFDTEVRQAGEFSRRIARNVQIILQEEAGLTRTADPAAGSYYVENLTANIARHAWELFREVERRGGYLASLESGMLQEMVAESAEAKRGAVSKRSMKLIGTNQYPHISEQPLQPTVQRASEETPIRGDVREAADTGSEIALPDGGMHSVSAAFASGADVAKVERALLVGAREEWKLRPLIAFRASEHFEVLRRSVEAQSPRPSVFLATFGHAFWRRARATFASGFYGTAGFEIIDNPGFPDVEAAAKAAADSGASIIVVCSEDERYPEDVPAFMGVLKEHGCTAKVVIAGNPAEHADALIAAGAVGFIHVRSDLGAELEATVSSLNIDIL